MVTDRGKKSKISASTEEDTDHIDKALVHSIESLQEVQEELEKVNEEASEKVLEVEQKFNEVRRPVYVKRDEIIRKIPDFWLNAFLSHPALGELLNHEDQMIFKFIESLDVEDFKDVKSGYSIAFNFKPNPYFEDTKLVKTFTFLDEGTTKIVGTPIKWKEGMGTENGGDYEKNGNKRQSTDDSFFNWFSETPQNVVAGFADEVADIIKEDLWPNPLKYFNSDPDEEDSEEEDDDDEQEEDEDEDEEDEDEDNDDE